MVLKKRDKGKESLRGNTLERLSIGNVSTEG